MGVDFKYFIFIFAENIVKLKKVRISPSLIKELIENGDILTFSYFIKLKYLHSNSTIYNFSIRKTSRLIGVSPNCAKAHLSKMRKMGIIRFTKNKEGNENITFISIEKVCEKLDLTHNKRCGSIEFHGSESVQIIKTRLYSKVLVNNINKQKFSIKQKSNSLMRKKDQVEKLKRMGNIPEHVLRSLASGRVSSDTFLCCDTIGGMFGGTKMTGYNQLLKMVDMGIFAIKKKYIPVLRKTTSKEFNRLCDKGELIRGKYFFNSLSSSIMKSAGFCILPL